MSEVVLAGCLDWEFAVGVALRGVRVDYNGIWNWIDFSVIGVED